MQRKKHGGIDTSDLQRPEVAQHSGILEWREESREHRTAAAAEEQGRKPGFGTVEGGSGAMAVPVRLLIASLLACVSLLRSLTAVSAFDRYTVGGSNGWNPGVNYTIWAKNKHFYVGDWLVFYYQSGQADIMQVNETAYNQCLADAPIVNYSRGRSFAFELNKTGRYYFICSRGYCYNGMKLAIKVEKIPPPPPPPHHRSGAAAPVRASGAAATLLRALGAAAAAALLRSI